MSSKYHIVFPRGDKSELALAEICEGMEYELGDYSVASRESFEDKQKAADYAQNLAKLHGLKFDTPNNCYLD